MPRWFVLLLGLVLASPALGQAYQHSDWNDGSVPARNWGVISTNPTGAAPADTFEPADAGLGSIVEADWISTTDGTVDYIQGAGNERKVRITCEPSTAKHLDAILWYGVPPPVGHRHQGTGAWNWSQNSIYTTLRASPSSTCSGGPLNATNYWEPELLQRLSNGLEIGRRPQTQTFYYVLGIQSDPMKWTWIRRNTAFIFGVNPADFNDTARRAEYSAAGFEYPGSPDTPTGFGGWQCFIASDPNTAVTVSNTAARMKSSSGVASTTNARYLKGPAGEDPWGGGCSGTTASPAEIILNLSAPQCWDRHNLRAPDGRNHFAHMARKSDNSITEACPTVTVDGVSQEYGHVPQLQVKTHWKVAGPSDYMSLRFSSDIMNPVGTPADPSSKDPCRQISKDFCYGATGHADWNYGWHSPIFDEAQRECLGVSVRGVAPTNGPGECNTSQISKFRKLKYSGASPDSTLSGNCATINSCSNAVPGNIERYAPILPGTKISGPVIHHLGN